MNGPLDLTSYCVQTIRYHGNILQIILSSQNALETDSHTTLLRSHCEESIAHMQYRRCIDGCRVWCMNDYAYSCSTKNVPAVASIEHAHSVVLYTLSAVYICLYRLCSYQGEHTA